jgi:serine-type D-Ala-D-Ala carboxypeptidase (penicillin-binding protein 5/6)
MASHPKIAQTLCLVLIALCGSAKAAEPTPASAPSLLSFKSHYLVDFATDTVLAASAADERLPPASLTKLMTAYLVFHALKSGHIHPEDLVPVSAKAWRMRGTRMFIEVNSRVAVEDLLRGMLIQSGNDASVALAEYVAGSVDGFVAEMNAAAKVLGMDNSAFRNPHGLPASGHYSSAHDLAILAKAIIDAFPEYYGLYAEREFSYNGITQQNRNALLKRDPSVDGMKTGHTSAAGYCLVSSALRDGMRLIAVVMGAQSAKSRNDGAQRLLDYGFSNYETRKLYSAGQQIEEAPVRGGAPEYVAIGPADDLYVTLPRGSFAGLEERRERQDDLAAPLPAGANVGQLDVLFRGRRLATSPLVILDEVAEGGVWTRLREGLTGLLQ